MLEAINLHKCFIRNENNGIFRRRTQTKVNAVNGIDISIQPGQIIGLLGVNGVEHPNEIKKIINMISGGERNIYWRLTAKENLEYFGALYNLKKEEINVYAMKALELVGLSDVKDTPVEQYSKGMKQRLQIARGLINNPKYIFLDEPTLGLDITIARDMRKYILSLVKNDNKGILLTSHYIAEVEELCDYVYILENGKIIASGLPSQIARMIQKGIKVVVSVLNLPDDTLVRLHEFAALHNADLNLDKNDSEVIITIQAHPDLSIPLVSLLIGDNLQLLQMAVSEPSLEDALIHLAMEANHLA